MKRSFTDLAPQEALHVAILIEQRNADIYSRFAEMFTEFGDEESLEVGAVFWEMAIEERGHHELLQQKYAVQYGSEECSLSEEDLVELIEVPRLESSDLFAEQSSPATARSRALQVAVDAETAAQRYYAELVKHTPSGPLHDVYQGLAEMEDGHVALLAAKIKEGTEATT